MKSTAESLARLVNLIDPVAEQREFRNAVDSAKFTVINQRPAGCRIEIINEGDRYAVSCKGSAPNCGFINRADSEYQKHPE